jgi:hypothetical protein
MSAKIIQYAEEKAKRLSLRTDTHPDVLWMRSYIRERLHDFIRERDEQQMANLMNDAFSS